MAERSFAKEVEKLRLGDGEEFAGEGILAITKALLQCGVGYVGGYQGAPISHLMDVLADAQDILGELGVHFEASASEATATAMLAASVHYPIRGAATFKSTVGTNVASDALANLASGGVTGGALIIVGEDYGEGSSIMQERSHAFAMKSQVWLLDPRPNLPSIVKAVEDGFELSEASNTPVMLEVRIRCCHVHGNFTAKDNKRPAMTVADALESPRRDTGRIVLPPASFLHEKEKVEKRWPAAVDFIRSRKINEFFGPDHGAVGIVMQGGMYNAVIRALQRLGLADTYGETDIPLYVLNAVYPLVDDEFLSLLRGQGRRACRRGGPAQLHRAGLCRDAAQGRARHAAGRQGVPADGRRIYRPGHARRSRRLPARRGAASAVLARFARPTRRGTARKFPISSRVVPGRPPGFCIGCPERPIFAATKLVEQELGKHHIASDIGCHLFSIMPPFELGATTMGYGLGPASASAFNSPDAKRRSISFVGDGGFWHNGLTSSIGNAVFNKNDGVIVIVDNFYSAATGGQDILSSRAGNKTKSTRHPIDRGGEGHGRELGAPHRPHL